VCRSLGGSDTGLTVATGFVCDGELSEVTAYHVEFDLNVVEDFATVDTDLVSYHFWHDNAVPQVSLDGDGSLSGNAVLLGLLALGIEADVFVLDFWIGRCVLLEKRLLILALKSSTTCS
jgi:hypothetical protein